MLNEMRTDAVAVVLQKVRDAIPTGADFEAALRHPLVTAVSPWELWPLIGLIRHERRQKWVGLIVETKLQGSGREIASGGALGHPEGVPQEGEVPDTPGWRYFFHGRGCCLTHTDGTSIDVDFADDGSSAEIDPWFYTQCLLSTPQHEWSDSQIRRGPPFEDAWQFELIRLRQLGLVDGKWRVRLTPRGRMLAEEIEPVVDEINRLATDDSVEGRRRMSWLLAELGDARSAACVLGADTGGVSAALRQRAESATGDRVAYARRFARCSDDNQRKLAITVLAMAGRRYVEDEIEYCMRSSRPSSIHFHCLKVVESWNDLSCGPLLQDALRRFAPARGIWGAIRRKWAPEKDVVERPRNGLIVEIARMLLNLHSPGNLPPATHEMLRSLLGGNRKACDAEAGFLLYLLSPGAGLTKLRSNVGHSIPAARKCAAVFLAMIGTDEALKTLVEMAQRPPECGGHEVACALGLLPDARAQAAAANWNRRNDGYEDAEGRETEINGRSIRTWSMDEVMRSNMRSFVQGDWDRLRRDYGHLLPKWQPVPQTRP